MRRFVLVLVLVALAAAAGVIAYTVYATDRDYVHLIETGDAAIARDQVFEALEAYSGAIALRPDSMLAHLKRGMAYRQRGELDAAARDLRRAAQIDPTSTRAQELLGDTNLALERYDRAAARYEAYLRLDDQSASVLYKLGLARYRAGQVAAARDALERAVRMDRTLAEAHLLLGLCLRDQAEARAARASLETAARLAPALTAPREALASVYAAAGDTARALDQLEALAALEPSRPERAIAVGLAHARAGRHEAAVLALGRAVERFPDVPLVYAALGRVWLDAAEARGDSVALKKALEALSTAASHSDVSSATLTDLGRAWLRSGDLVAAERVLRQAIARLPVAPEAYLHLAGIDARDGRLLDARDELVRYATLVGDRAPLAAVATQIADYSMRLAEPALAVRWLERAIDEAGPTSVLLARMADAALRAGDRPRAARAVEQGLALEPNDRALLALRRRLTP